MPPLLSLPGWDTWLARRLLEQGSVSREVLAELLTRARAQRQEGVTLAQLLSAEGHLPAEAHERAPDLGFRVCRDPW